MSQALVTKVFQSGGTYDTKNVDNSAGLTINVNFPVTRIVGGALTTVQTILTGQRGPIRIQNAGASNASLVDNTGNLDLGGSNVVLGVGEAAILERRDNANGTSTRWAFVTKIAN